MPRKLKLAAIKSYVSTQGISDEALLKMAKLGAVVDGWMKETEVVMSAVQCWTAIEEYFGVVPCTVMSMMSNDLLPSACEVDICGVVGMYALQMASGTPSALLDWNNNYGDDPDKAVCFHCSNLPKHFFADVRMDFQEIIAGTVGKAEHVRHLRGPSESRADELLPRLDRRRHRQTALLCGRRRVHQRSAGHIRRRRRSAHRAVAGSAALHLPERLGASRGRELFLRGGDGARGWVALPRLGHALAQELVHRPVSSL